MSLIFRVEGVQDILERMSRIAPGIQKKYLGGAVKAVATPHLKDVRSLVRRGPTGNLKRSVGVIVEKKRKSRTAVAVLGFRRGGGGKKTTERGFHSWWIEHGVKARTSKSGKMLKVPVKGNKYPYLKGLMSTSVDGSKAAYFRQVKGFAGTGKFKRWADANLPGIRAALERELGTAVNKAIAEETRRAAKAVEKSR
jgi:hypothetical protein